MQGWYCVENLTRQRHDRDQTENQLRQPAGVDSCFELFGSRQHGVAKHLEEQPSETNVLPNARGSDFGRARPKSSRSCPRHGMTTNNEQRTRKMSLSC